MLTLAYMNAEALARTRETGELQFFSRSRRRAVAQGRDERQHAGGARAALRLRRRRAARAGRAGRAGLPHRRAHLLLHAASSSRRRRTRRCAALERTLEQRARERPAGSYTTELLADPPRIGEKVLEEADEVARAAREESDERVAEEAADVLYHLAVLLRSRGLQPGRRGTGARWPSPLRRRPSRRRSTRCERWRVPRRSRSQPDPAAPLVHRRLRDAGVGLPQAARRRARRSCSSRPSRASASAAGRSSASSRARSSAGRSATTATRTRSPPPRSARHRQAPLAGPAAVHRRRGRRASATTSCATVEPLGEPNPDPVGLPDLALMLTDVLVVFDHLRHTVIVLANVYADEDVDARLRRSASRRSPTCAGGSPGRCRARAALRARIARCRTSESNMARESVRGDGRRGSSSTSAPATRTRSFPSQRWSASAPVEPFSIYRGLRAVNPSPVHVLPRLRRLPGRRRDARSRC